MAQTFAQLQLKTACQHSILVFHKSATEQTFFSRSVKVKVNSMVSVGSKYWPIGVMSQVSFSRLDLKSWHLRRDMSKFKILPYEHSPVELLDLTGVLKNSAVLIQVITLTTCFDGCKIWYSAYILTSKVKFCYHFVRSSNIIM